MSSINKFNITISLNTKIIDALDLMKASKDNNYIAGIAVITDTESKVIGVITDGDIRRGLLKEVSLQEEVRKIANMSPILINKNLNYKERLQELRKRTKNFINIKNRNTIILIDDYKRLYDVVSINNNSFEIDQKNIAIYGLGFVGLTLAATLANNGLNIIAVDSDFDIIHNLNNNKVHFFEKGLKEMLVNVSNINPITFLNDVSNCDIDVHIVCVGTPTDKNGKPDLKDLLKVSDTIADNIKKNDLVVFRSTLPVGTMRNIIKPQLEKNGLQCGADFSLSFAPERTVEGDALKELSSLPQIIGAIDQRSADHCMSLFKRITHTIIQVDSLEEAELVKLLNNTYRDLVFSFANEVSTICDHYNINAFNLIHAANNGYPRNKIPTPSPGVGGTCLSKDPYIYSNPITSNKVDIKLGKISRSINNKGAEYVYKKIKKFASEQKLSINNLKILIVGIAFKGIPETSDIRGSASVELLKILGNPNNLSIKDYVIDTNQLTHLNIDIVEDSVGTIVKNYDAIIYMNNHHKNTTENVLTNLKNINKPFLFFDGWNMFNQVEVESIDHISYSTMGYMTKS